MNTKAGGGEPGGRHLRLALVYAAKVREWSDHLGRHDAQRHQALAAVAEEWDMAAHFLSWLYERSGEDQVAARVVLDLSAEAGDLLGKRESPAQRQCRLEAACGAAVLLRDESAQLRHLGSLSEVHYLNGDRARGADVRARWEQPLRQRVATRVGRRRVDLEERAARWAEFHDPGVLPGPWSYLALRLSVPRRQWQARERALMSAARRRLVRLYLSLAVVLVVLALAAAGLWTTARDRRVRDARAAVEGRMEKLDGGPESRAAVEAAIASLEPLQAAEASAARQRLYRSSADLLRDSSGAASRPPTWPRALLKPSTGLRRGAPPTWPARCATSTSDGAATRSSSLYPTGRRARRCSISR